MLDNKTIGKAMTIKLGNELPEYPEFDDSKRRAPDRGFRLTKAQTKIALKNALRFFQYSWILPAWIYSPAIFENNFSVFYQNFEKIKIADEQGLC